MRTVPLLPSPYIYEEIFDLPRNYLLRSRYWIRIQYGRSRGSLLRSTAILQ